MQALAESGRVSVDWVVADSIRGSWREKQGWPVFEAESINLIVSPPPERVATLLQERKDQSLHIFTGIHAEEFMRATFLSAVRSGCRCGLLNEYQPPQGRFGFAKRLVHTAYRMMFGKHIFALFCIGMRSVDWYRKVGYPESKLVNWMYTPQPPVPPRRDLWPDAKVPHIMFLSTLSETKGADLFVDALLELGDLEWKASLIGEGPLAEELHAKIAASPLRDRFETGKFRPYAEAMALLATADLAVVPSRHDGWGTIVSEALRLGVPVIASKNCGASDVLREAWRGTVIPEASVPALAAALREWIPRLPLPPEERERIFAWSDRLSGETAAGHFLASLDAISAGEPPPTPPWMTPS